MVNRLDALVDINDCRVMEQTSKQIAGDLYYAITYISSVDYFAAVQRRQQGFQKLYLP